MRKVVALQEFRAIREQARMMDHWDEPDHQNERDLRKNPTMISLQKAIDNLPEQKADNLMEAKEVLRKAMRLVQDLTNHQELAAITAQELEALRRMLVCK